VYSEQFFVNILDMIKVVKNYSILLTGVETRFWRRNFCKEIRSNCATKVQPWRTTAKTHK